MVANHDYAVNNTGLLLFSDIAINAVGLAFVLWHAAALRRAATPMPSPPAPTPW